MSDLRIATDPTQFYNAWMEYKSWYQRVVYSQYALHLTEAWESYLYPSHGPLVLRTIRQFEGTLKRDWREQHDARSEIYASFGNQEPCEVISAIVPPMVEFLSYALPIVPGWEGWVEYIWLLADRSMLARDVWSLDRQMHRRLLRDVNELTYSSSVGEF